jgi:MFS family permease
MSPAAGVVLFLAPALGPSLGGVLISNLGWPSIFLLNVPFALVGIFGVMKMDGDLAPRRDGGARFDAAGLSLLSAGLALSTYGASQAPITGWWSAAALPFWAVGLAFLAGYAVWARRRQGPAVSLALLADPQGALAIGLSVITGLALFAVLFLVPVYVQDVQGFSAMAAGLMLLPQGLVLAAGTMLGDVLTKRRLVRPGVISGMAILAASTATLALLTPSTPAWTTALLLCGRGFALGLTIQPLIVTTLGRLAPRELADASTLFNIVERVAGSFGVALIGTFFQVRAMSHVDAALGVLPSGGGGLNSLAQLPAPLRALVAIAITDGFHDTIWVLVGLCATGCLASLFLKGRSRGGGTLRVPATVP